MTTINTTRKALELVEPFLADGRYWASIITDDKKSYVEVGAAYDGFQESRHLIFIVHADGKVIEGSFRI